MPVETIMSAPLLISLTTEDNPRGTRVDEWGNTVDIYRLRQVEIQNPSGAAWDLVIYRDGNPVYTNTIPVGLQQVFTIQTNRRFDLTLYSVSLSRIIS